MQNNDVRFIFTPPQTAVKGHCGPTRSGHQSKKLITITYVSVCVCVCCFLWMTQSLQCFSHWKRPMSVSWTAVKRPELQLVRTDNTIYQEEAPGIALETMFRVHLSLRGSTLPIWCLTYYSVVSCARAIISWIRGDVCCCCPFYSCRDLQLFMSWTRPSTSAVVSFHLHSLFVPENIVPKIAMVIEFDLFFKN